MNLSDLKKIKLPCVPGVYFFRDEHNRILYIGKATSIKDRVRSYFSKDLIDTRGEHIVSMIEKAQLVTFEKTQSVLQALLLEAKYIKKNQPKYNTRDKDDKSLNYIVITDEEYPRVLLVREKELYNNSFKKMKIKYSFGPFPQSGVLKDALKLVRKIFPYRDTCTPNARKPCFNRQIGLCPGVCTGGISKTEYQFTIRYIKSFLNGKKNEVARHIKKKMFEASRKKKFEKANELKRILYSLEHINDIALIRDELPKIFQGRIEAYDISHTSGTNIVGVMIVIESGRVSKSAYRKFNIRSVQKKPNDTKALSEVLERRLTHTEWQYPALIVVDGGTAQKRTLETVLRKLDIQIPVVGVVKNEHHKPKKILGNKSTIAKYKKEILLANSESHRFAVSYHRTKRDKLPKT